jgi:hypothetical protein
MLEGLHALDHVVADRDRFPVAFIQRMATRNLRIGIFSKNDLKR